MQQEEPTTTTSSKQILSTEAMEAVSNRLSQLENLYFPRALQPSAATPADRHSLLLSLLHRDPAVFLERYGLQLTSEELKQFDALKEDYEINWHLSHLRKVMSPTKEELKSRSNTIKNRRRAYMDRLMVAGQYFSEDAMREREPYLHHEYLGKFQDPSGRRMARPGERWSETLMRWTEEAILVAKIRGEQQKLGVAPSDWVGNEMYDQQHAEEEMEEEEGEEEDDEEEEEGEEEEEDEEEEEKDEECSEAKGSFYPMEVHSGNVDSLSTNQPISIRPAGGATLSVEEMRDRMDQFTQIMQQKFLSGEDHEHLDYSKIDEDETLDDHWMREANQDAEEKYFADV